MRVEVTVFILSVFEAHIFVVLLNTGWLWGNLRRCSITSDQTPQPPTNCGRYITLLKQNPF